MFKYYCYTFQLLYGDEHKHADNISIRTLAVSQSDGFVACVHYIENSLKYDNLFITSVQIETEINLTAT